jgi:outer membrane protein TolC
LAHSERLPTIGVGAHAIRSQFFSDYAGLRTPNPRNRAVGLSVDLGFPLFDGYRAASGVARARADLAGALSDAAAERLALERDIRAALIDLDDAWASIALTDRVLSLSRRRLELAQEQYEISALVFTELQDATEAAARAERGSLTAKFEFATALATLEERVGAPIAAGR